MVELRTLLVRLGGEQAGGETAEYAVVTGLVIVAAIATVVFVGKKIATQWTMVKVSRF